MSVRDIDKGWNRIVEDIAEFSSKDVVIGWIEGKKQNRNKSDSGGKSSITNAELATVHEFGTDDGRIPEGRLGFREWADRSKEEIADRVTDAFKTTVGEGNPIRQLNRLGLWGVSAWRKYQRSVQPGPVLSDATLALKLKQVEGDESKLAKNKKLRDSGQLINSATHQVRRKSRT